MELCEELDVIAVALSESCLAEKNGVHQGFEKAGTAVEVGHPYRVNVIQMGLEMAGIEFSESGQEEVEVEHARAAGSEGVGLVRRPLVFDETVDHLSGDVKAFRVWHGWDWGVRMDSSGAMRFEKGRSVSEKTGPRNGLPGAGTSGPGNQRPAAIVFGSN